MTTLRSSLVSGLKRYGQVLLPSLLLALLPVVFFYNHNAAKLSLPSLVLPLLIMALAALLTTAVAMLLNRGSAEKALIVSVLFLIAFYFYGTLYNLLLKIDLLQVEHFTLLPAYLFCVALLIRLVRDRLHIESKFLFRGTLLLFGGLILFNLLGILPVELRKAEPSATPQPASSKASPTAGTTRYPDIYYIVMDESVGFNALRSYWHYPQIDDFENFLKSKGFFIAENSRSKTHETLIELASRLNFEDMSQRSISVQDWYDAVGNNKVMQILKSYGYTTVVLDQVRAANGYPNKTVITADYHFDATRIYSRLWAFDDFFFLVFNRTLLRPFCDRITLSDPNIIQHRNDVLFFFDKLSNLQDIHSPKFVYAQVLLTHVPLIFDANGGMLDSRYYYDWNYYLQSYKFEVSKLTSLVTSLLDQADPSNPPIIILQSDHGFRNILNGHVGSTVLPNYPEADKYAILNAMLLPGFDSSSLPDDLDPVNTFPIIFNQYFGLHIPLQ